MAAQEGPGGHLWLLARSPTAAALWEIASTGTVEHWTLPPADQDATLQTVGSGHVWFGLGAGELALDRVAGTFSSYVAGSTVAVSSVDGFSVALDIPASPTGTPAAAPDLSVAPLGGSQAQDVTLPQAPVPEHLAGAVLAGQGGQAIVVAAHHVWTLALPALRATNWGPLPSAAWNAPAAWGNGRLWVVVNVAGTPSGIDSLSSGGAAQPLSAAEAHPPRLDSPLIFAAGRLWWAADTHIVSYDPATAKTTLYAYPQASRPVGVAIAPAPGGVWLGADAWWALVS